MNTLHRLLALALPFWHWMTAAVLLSFATIFASVGLMGLSAWIIARAALQPSIAVLGIAIAGVRFFGVSRGVFRYLERYVSHQVTFRLLSRLRVWFYERLEPLAPARLTHFRSGDLLARVISDIETLEHFYVRVVGPPLVALVTGLIVLGIMAAFFDPLLAPALLVFFLLSALGVPFLTWRLAQAPDRDIVAARGELNAGLLDSVQGLSDLAAYGQTGQHYAQNSALSQRLIDQQARLAWISGLQSALNLLLILGAVVALLVLAIPRVDPLYLAPIALLTMAAFEAFLPLTIAAQHLGSTHAAAERLFEIVDAEPTVRDPEQPSPRPARCELKIEGLHFAYSAEAAPALQDFHLHLPEGGRVAIVGASGAGKSTLVNLLQRFWDYEQGSIQLGGHELRTFHGEDLRALMGVVTQRTHLFNATIEENLRLARPGATQAEIVAAAQQAQIHEFILSLPEGYGTWVGEQGTRLSGGERQRLAIARALLKDAPLLILDEATANLDAVTEREVMGAILPLTQTRTTLMITHRLVGLEGMDEIIVLQEGCIVERGTHAELLARQGAYWQMLQIQNQLLEPEVVNDITYFHLTTDIPH
ncbi:MAG: thiol reductant ABC exporter subunit CydC [Anaerolineae bacterium]|nr:thiol reductant ABC exporter subunit CydC [Anaerolineae bacterium]